MKLDIHNHILPESWPNLKEVIFVIYLFFNCFFYQNNFTILYLELVLLTKILYIDIPEIWLWWFYSVTKKSRMQIQWNGYDERWYIYYYFYLWKLLHFHVKFNQNIFLNFRYFFSSNPIWLLGPKSPDSRYGSWRCQCSSIINGSSYV